MNEIEILNKLNEIFSDIFDDEMTLSLETESSDIEDWDSLTHITLISAIEDEFNIQFNMNDIAGMKSVGKIVEKIKEQI